MAEVRQQLRGLDRSTEKVKDGILHECRGGMYCGQHVCRGGEGKCKELRV